MREDTNHREKLPRPRISMRRNLISSFAVSPIPSARAVALLVCFYQAVLIIGAYAREHISCAIMARVKFVLNCSKQRKEAKKHRSFRYVCCLEALLAMALRGINRLPLEKLLTESSITSLLGG
jgi:hypothetical protein